MRAWAAEAISWALATAYSADGEPSEPTMTRSYTVISRWPPSGMTVESSSDFGGLTHSMARPAQPSSTPASSIAWVPSLSRKFSKMKPKVTVWISIGTTIIMLRIPM